MITKANQLANFPLNFLRTGLYNCADGKLYYRTTHGIWWFATGHTEMVANNLTTHTNAVNPLYSNSRGYDFALR